MKLYRLDMDNGYPYEDNDTFTMLIVAENETIARERVDKEMVRNLFTNEEAGYSLEEITEIDGYKIIIL